MSSVERVIRELRSGENGPVVSAIQAKARIGCDAEILRQLIQMGRIESERKASRWEISETSTLVFSEIYSTVAEVASKQQISSRRLIKIAHCAGLEVVLVKTAERKSYSFVRSSDLSILEGFARCDCRKGVKATSDWTDLEYECANLGESFSGHLCQLKKVSGHPTHRSVFARGGIRKWNSAVNIDLAALSEIILMDQRLLKVAAYRSVDPDYKSTYLLGHSVFTIDLDRRKSEICPQCVEEKGFVEIHFDLKIMYGRRPTHPQLMKTPCRETNHLNVSMRKF